MKKSSKIILIVVIIVAIALVGVWIYFGIKNNKDSDNKADKSSSMEGDVVNEEKALYVYSSADNAAYRGNPELLYVYEINDNVIKFKYKAPWNSEDIKGTAKKIETDLYVYESGNKKIELLLNSVGEDSIKVTEYENGSETSFKNLWK